MTNISEKHNVNSNKNHKSHDFIKAEIAIRAVILGFVMGSSFLSSFHVNFSQLTIYFVFLSLFHFLEFWITALYNPLNASISSFLFSNGYQYILAHCFTILEYLLEYLFFPQIKMYKFISYIGFVIACFGQICRTLSMIHATQNFSHKISLKKVKEHVLVTNGIYRWIRHPSYFGFFFWAIGSQIMLLNPLSSIAYTVILWIPKKHNFN
ncbi:protein-S-isoprenylcysteine carboxyl O-methyltransferase [Pneumocystis jirovecii RU7]|uniref:Protein-S-isoprenylcysteine O-methyltransferase n=1 Tax=Pneumocystis jirovecii (strain RU7) TaxID=1408657 RepID=A0A0W4ZHS9_PNEJ7|nr:protein-S-isoprenylcysteine carboxyl O-methyltransferase [Pneumocystis jirovecii RU7]KTW27930.1 hypothetical protein T551_02897 [Pneumocystis jirovecii RU7]